MSCCCSYIVDTWNPCSCGCSYVTTTTTTSTTTCIGETCDEAIDPRCIIYNGSDIPCYGVQTGNSAAEILQIIINQFGCIITPSLGRCTAGVTAPEGLSYYKIERTWSNPSYTFTLTSIILNGVDYTPTTPYTITINPPGDLIVAISIFDGLPYIQNVTDWLNAFPAVINSGFIFYDEMRVIDKPHTTSTFSIIINNNYIYDSVHGFGLIYGDVINILGMYSCEEILPS